jgi:hypothetical protein
LEKGNWQYLLPTTRERRTSSLSLWEKVRVKGRPLTPDT